MNNLTQHMSELRRILATIENKPLIEGAVGETGEQFVKRLIGKSGKELVKELGPRVEVAVVIKKPKIINGTPTGEVVEREIKEVWEHMPGTELYAIKTVNGVVPKRIITRTADVIKTEVETAAKEGRAVKSTSTNATKAVDKPSATSADPVADATAKAERLSISELEKKIASGEGTALERKAFAKELEKKKAGTPPAEKPKDKFDSADVARKKAQGMSREELEAALKNKDIPAVTRKEYEAELAKRPATAPKAADDVTKAADDVPTTGAEVLVKKEIEREKAVAKNALDDGTVKIKEENLLPKKPNETPSEQLERTLKDDPSYKGAWEGLEGTEKEVGFWARLGRKAKIGGLISIPVLLAAGGAYIAMRDKPDDGSGDETFDGDETDTSTENDKKKAKEKEEADAKKAKDEEEANRIADRKDAEANANPVGAADANSGETNQGQKTTSDTADGEGDATEQSAELTNLKAQIDALIAELSKSKDPAIQKRLAAVKAKLGQAGQGPSVTSTEKGGWKNIGNNYRRWYGPDGRDEEGSFHKRGDLDTIPYDAGQVDKWAKMSNQEKLVYLRNAERAGKLK